MNKIFFILFFCLAFLGTTGAALAQPINPETNRIDSPMTVIDAMTLRSPDYIVTIWGVKPFGNLQAAAEIQTRDKLEQLVQNQAVNCRVLSKTDNKILGRCGVASGQDIGLYMIQNGLLQVDRIAVTGSAYAETYEQAERGARDRGRGLWQAIDEKSTVPPWLSSQIQNTSSLQIAVVVAAIFVFIILVMKLRLRRIERHYEEALRNSKRREESLQKRERAVLASAVEGELRENVNKIDAFLTIYREMLKDLQDTTKTPSYQEAEELVHQRPALNRTVYDANVAQLSVFNMKLGSDIAKLYTLISSDPEYQILNQKTPVSTAIKIIQGIIADAESLKQKIQNYADKLEKISMQYAAAQTSGYDVTDEDLDLSEEAEGESETSDDLVARRPFYTE